MQILQTKNFAKIVKKLKSNRKTTVDQAVHEIANNPEIGALKTGDLCGVRVYKFYCLKQLMLLSYKVESDTIILLLHLGDHENFYTTLKHLLKRGKIDQTFFDDTNFN